jgi:hypothetical protein
MNDMCLDNKDENIIQAYRQKNRTVINDLCKTIESDLLSLIKNGILLPNIDLGQGILSFKSLRLQISWDGVSLLCNFNSN